MQIHHILLALWLLVVVFFLMNFFKIKKPKS